ncbi:hypothetical protein AGLY_009929 [Aphis glycines]|uniref:Uncharacterized protein n=1 Tax=Aphis glycines TaxID=307491 RepID=A0A6G0TGU0_APHGL|nr:hypothetical protein AGLY_009929 [Aphis glycines]
MIPKIIIPNLLFTFMFRHGYFLYSVEDLYFLHCQSLTYYYQHCTQNHKLGFQNNDPNEYLHHLYHLVCTLVNRSEHRDPVHPELHLQLGSSTPEFDSIQKLQISIRHFGPLNCVVITIWFSARGALISSSALTFTMARIRSNTYTSIFTINKYFNQTPVKPDKQSQPLSIQFPPFKQTPVEQPFGDTGTSHLSPVQLIEQIH